MALTYEVHVTTGWAVLGADDRVIVIVCGRDADEAAQEWTGDGSRVVPVTL